MMMIKIKILLVIFLISCQSNANVFLSVKELPFVPEKISNLNKIEVISEYNENLQPISYNVNTCYPVELVTEGNKKIYRPSRNSEKAVRYVNSIYNQKGQKVEMIVNGLQIVIDKAGASFVLIDNCTKLLPVLFESGKEQDYLEVKLQKGNFLDPSIKNDYFLWGKIGEDGYLERGWTRYTSVVEKLKDFEYAKKRNEPVTDCLRVYESVDKKDNSYFIYKKKRYEYDNSYPNFWHANSKYLGHRLCSDQPNAVIDCQGTAFVDSGGTDAIFGTNDHYLVYATNEAEEIQYTKEFNENLKKAKELGKKCDAIIAKHEKETGKKVKISPFYPEELLKKDK